MNSVELKTLSELSQYSFYIPAYQRGYRWTKQEVKDLLNDINEFIPKEIDGSDEKTWYCLQPVVVKQKEDGIYEVIDGQQRLTTAYLILYYLNQDFVEKRGTSSFSLIMKLDPVPKFSFNIRKRMQITILTFIICIKLIPLLKHGLRHVSSRTLSTK